MRLARDPERNGFAAETEWTGRLLATEETQRRRRRRFSRRCEALNTNTEER